MYNLKIWIKETLSLSKARGVITENILLLKYQKQAITAALNGYYNSSNIKKKYSYVVTYCLEKIVDIPNVAFYCQLGYFTDQE